MIDKKEIYELDYADFRVFVTKGFEEGYGKSATEAYEEFKQGSPDKAKEINMDMFLKITEDDYKDTIQMAVRRGKPVPENILKEFSEFEKDKPELMEMAIDRKILLNALSNIKSITSGKHTLAILSSILIIAKNNDEIEINATDLEIGFQGIYPAKVIKTGNIAIPVNELFFFVSKSKKNEISIKMKEMNYASISGGEGSFDIFCMNADDFPLIPEEINCKKTIEIDALNLKDMISKAIIVRPQDEEPAKRTHIIGALFKVIKKEKQKFLQIASTNGGIFVQDNKEIFVAAKAAKINKPAKEGALIPKTGLTKLNRSFLKNIKKTKKAKGKNKGFDLFSETENQPKSIEDVVSLEFQKDNFVIQKENETIIIRLLKGDFPDYQDLVTSDNYNIKANRKDLINSMKQMQTMKGENYKTAEISIEKNIMKMHFANPERGETKREISIQYDGEKMELVYVPDQFIDFLNLMQSDIVDLSIKNNETPCMITGEQDKGCIFLIMPCRTA